MSGARSSLCSDLLPAMKSKSPYFSMDAVRGLLDEKGLEIKDGTLRHYMSDAMAQGIVHDAGRGWYSGIKEPCKLDPKPVKKIVKLLEKEFPLLDFVCWSTQQINPWMHHILSKFITFVNVEKDGLSTVSDFLRGRGYDVYSNPGADRVSEVRAGDKAIVIRPLNSVAPHHDSHFSPPEAVLVDLCVEAQALHIIDPGESKDMAQSLAETSRISLGTLLYYADKRELSKDDVFAEPNTLMEK